MDFCDTIFKIAVLDPWFEKLNKLKSLALEEDWKFKSTSVEREGKETPILENYIVHTFRKLVHEYECATDIEEKNSIIYISDDKEKMCFNTGLYTRHYQEIYACFERNNRPGNQGTKIWFLKSFSDSSDRFLSNISHLPRRANYFSNASDLIYDVTLPLRVNSAHILQNPKNKMRIPEQYRDAPNLVVLFEGAIQLTQKIVQANYRAAVPVYYKGSINLMLPICLQRPDKADLSLAVRKMENHYEGKTCLTIDMAYNNARLIAFPNSDWLRTDIIDGN